MNVCCEAPKGERKKAQVEDQLEAMDCAIYRLSEMVDRLSAKLSPVTRQPEPCCANGASAMLNLVPVADSIRSMKDRVLDVSDQLDSLFSRIEL